MGKLERIRGCFLAGACGDALGYPVEFEKSESIREQYGKQGVREMVLSREGEAQITDDTQMTLFTAEGMLCSLRHGRDVTECIHQSYLDWMQTQGWKELHGIYHRESRLLPVKKLHARRAPGNTCLGALISEPNKYSKGCGGVMRTAPCGMLNLLPDRGEDAFALQGAMAAAITHGHLMGYVPAAMLADMIHLILTESCATLEDVTLRALEKVSRLFSPDVEAAEGCENCENEGDGRFGQMLDFRMLMSRAITLAKTDIPAEEAIGMLGQGWVGDEALAISVYCCLKYPDDMEECLSAAVTHKGDSDSTGAIAGNILGAWLGEEAIPPRWLEVLENRDIIEEMAGLIHAAG